MKQVHEVTCKDKQRQYILSTMFIKNMSNIKNNKKGLT